MGSPKYIFTTSNSSLIIELNTESGKFNPEILSFKIPSVQLGINLNVFESGNFVKSFLFHNIESIDGVAPINMIDAFNKLNILLGGVASSQNTTEYNNIEIYDTPANLPITFPSNTIHAISILAVTGTLTITIGGEQTILATTQKTDITASGLISDEIVLNSTTGTFLVSVSKK